MTSRRIVPTFHNLKLLLKLRTPNRTNKTSYKNKKVFADFRKHFHIWNKPNVKSGLIGVNSSIFSKAFGILRTTSQKRLGEHGK